MRVVIFIALLALSFSWHSQAHSQNYCPPGSIPDTVDAGPTGNAGMCKCADGSWASIYGCPSATQQQPQYQSAPQPVVGCGSWNCPLGTTCSRVNANTCINPGFSECPNGGTCGPGLKCTGDGLHCVPVANSECGDHSCQPGSHCGSRNVCITDGAYDCGNGSSCSQDKKCSRDGKICLDKDVLDCGGHVCPAGSKCGVGGSCLPIDATDCGNGTSCPSDSLCKRGGGCITRQGLTQTKADDIARKVAAEAEQKAAAQKRIEDAKEAERQKEDERQRIIAQQKADVEAKTAEEARAKEEARLAALKKIEDDRVAALAQAEENQRVAALQKELIRLQKQPPNLATQVNVEKAKVALQAAKANGDLGADLVKSLSQAGAKSGDLAAPPPAISSATFVAIAKVANDPNQAQTVRNLAAWLLQVQEGTAPNGIAGVYRPSAAGLSYLDAMVAEEQAHVRALLAQSGNLPLGSVSEPSGIAQMISILNDPAQTNATRELSGIALGLDANTIAQGNLLGGPASASAQAAKLGSSSAPCETENQILANLGNGKKDSSPICPAGSVGASATTGAGGDAQSAAVSPQPLKLNGDVKTDIVTLSPLGEKALPSTVSAPLANAASSIAPVGGPSTFKSPVALGASTPVGGAIPTTSPAQTPNLWNRVEGAYSYANQMADNDPNFTRGVSDINGTISAIKSGAQTGWTVGGPGGAIAGAVLGAKINSVAGNIQDYKSIYGDIARGDVSGTIREAVVVGEDKVVDKGSDMLFDAATAGAGVASPISLASAMRVDASWGTYFLVGFFNGSPEATKK